MTVCICPAPVPLATYVNVVVKFRASVIVAGLFQVAFQVAPTVIGAGWTQPFAGTGHGLAMRVSDVGLSFRS